MSSPGQSGSYHLHVYFSDDTEESAWQLREKAQHHPLVDQVGRFHPAPVGPHPVRQFQLRVKQRHLEQVVDWLETHRGDFDVLIHPEVEDDLLAHTVLASWLGKAHPLNLSCFEAQ